MQILEKGPYELTDTAVCIGKFDGLHSGHKLLLESLRSYKNLRKVLFTFSFPGTSSIYSEDEKRYLAEKLGIDYYISCPFDRELSQMSPDGFLSGVLLGECGAKAISVGEDFRFGYERRGDTAFLQRESAGYGYELNVFPKKKLLGEVVSSTRIRKELKEGKMEAVNTLLGEPYFIMGTVCRGNQIGRTLGMPTANLTPPPGKILPPFGVYASRVTVEDKVYTGVTNIGVKPTIPGESRAGVETYLMDFNSNLYGRQIRVELYRFLRGEKKFSGLEALKRQMGEDKRNVDLFFGQSIG